MADDGFYFYNMEWRVLYLPAYCAAHSDPERFFQDVGN